MSFWLKKVRLNQALSTHCSTDWIWNCRKGMLKDFDLWYVTAGQGWLETSDGRLDISPADCFILRPGRQYLARHDPDDPLSVTAVHFDYLDSRGRAVHPHTKDLPPLHRKIRDTAFLDKLLRRVVSAAGEGATGGGEADEWFRAVLLEIHRCDSEPAMPAHQQEQFRSINRLCEKIAADPAGAYRIENLAERMGYSPDHFARLFRRYKGLSPGEFIIRTRIEAAKTLLHSSSHSITRISELLGYNDVYFFSKQFRQKVHVTPRKFRDGKPKPNRFNENAV